jgi:type I restriction enzyme S subunit
VSARKLITEHLDLWTGAVTKKSSRGRGSNGKVALTGIKKLRELILELAIMGLLVEQSPEDETAADLLCRISDEKDAQVKAKEIREPKELAKVGAAERPYSIPKNWQFCRLNNIGIWGAGSTPKRGDSKYYNGQIPWFKSGELSQDFISVSEETITELAVKETSVRMNSPGDVLIAMYGATIGKASILEVSGTTNQAVCACTPWLGVSNRFLLLLLKAYRSRFIAMGAGGAQPNISREKLINTAIGLPPCAEQHRIVQKVDELMALCDRLEQQTSDQLEAHETLVDTLLGTLTQSENATELADNWVRLATHFDTLFTTEQSIDKLKQAILQLAVMGRLVEQDAGDEAACDYLKKLSKTLQANRSTKGKRSTAASAVLADEEPYTLPSSWKFCRLGELAEFENGDRSSRYPNSADLVDEGIPFFGAKEIVDGKLQFTDELRLITPEKFDSLSNGKLKNNDFVILLRGMVGKIARFYASEKYDTGFINAQMLIIRLPNPEVADYFQVFASSQVFKEAIAEKITGSAVKQMPASVLPQILFPLPPRDEQHRIVQKVDELMALCDQLKERLGQASETRCQLARTIVEQAVH